MTQSPFSAIPRSSVEAKALVPLNDEASALGSIVQEILTWFFSNTGKHRDLLLQNPTAEGFSIDPKAGDLSRPLTIQQIGAYSYRKNPSIVIDVGIPKTEVTGMGVTLEHNRAASAQGCMIRRSMAKIQVSLYAETDSEQMTRRLGKLLGEIFMEHIPAYYQNVIMNDENHSQVIFPRTSYDQHELTRDFQPDSQVERLYLYQLSFECTFESIKLIKSHETPILRFGEGNQILEHDLEAKLKLGKIYLIRVSTNLLGVKLFSSNSGIFTLQQISGPHGEKNGDRIYRGQALRTGIFKLVLKDREDQVVETEHSVGF